MYVGCFVSANLQEDMLLKNKSPKSQKIRFDKCMEKQRFWGLERRLGYL